MVYRMENKKFQRLVILVETMKEIGLDSSHVSLLASVMDRSSFYLLVALVESLSLCAIINTVIGSYDYPYLTTNNIFFLTSILCTFE